MKSEYDTPKLEDLACDRLTPGTHIARHQDLIEETKHERRSAFPHRIEYCTCTETAENSPRTEMVISPMNRQPINQIPRGNPAGAGYVWVMYELPVQYGSRYL